MTRLQVEEAFSVLVLRRALVRWFKWRRDRRGHDARALAVTRHVTRTLLLGYVTFISTIISDVGGDCMAIHRSERSD
jgi:hypothetical protein